MLQMQDLYKFVIDSDKVLEALKILIEIYFSRMHDVRNMCSIPYLRSASIQITATISYSVEFLSQTNREKF
jgi:hypothetical protein